MIRQKFNYKPFNWQFFIYYIVTAPNADEIIDRLEQIGCSGPNIKAAHDNLTSGKLDTGLTYTNQKAHKTIIVIAKTSTALEFFQSITHEMGHASCHIAEYYGIPLDGEEVRYICDGLLMRTWPISRELLCDCCRKL